MIGAYQLTRAGSTEYATGPVMEKEGFEPHAVRHVILSHALTKSPSNLAGAFLLLRHSILSRLEGWHVPNDTTCL
jgi:hypothetical protein